MRTDDLKTRPRSAQFGAVLLGALCLMASAAHADTIRMVSSEYAPYFGKDLPNGGVITDIVATAFKRTGHSMTVDYVPFARALAAGKDGSAVGVIALWHNQEREQWFAFSAPLPPNQIGFYALADAAIHYATMADLKSYTVGIVRGYANPKAFDDAKLSTEEANDDATNFRKLMAGRINLALVDKGVGQYLIDTTMPELKNKVSWLPPTVESVLQYVAFSKASPGDEKYLDAFNTGLQEMEKDGTLAKMVAAGGI